MAVRRTTIELDEDLLARAQAALAQPTIRSTVEEALRRALDDLALASADRVARQRHYLAHLTDNIDLEVWSSEEMWR